jgi:23S rRNA (pseudouridine1915-N3)-methyltransferase
MRLTLIGVGRLKAGPERELFARYFKRAADLARAQGIAAIEMREIDESRARRAEDRCSEEARAIRAAVPKGAWLTLLDERGAALTSRQWAEQIGRARDGGVGAYALAIGGPDGLDPALKTEARALINFGAVTWPHQLVRAMAAEQLYRALSILSGRPYHRD